MSEQIDSNTLVSHTDAKGRTLSGMGADVEQLAETMERHAPPTEKEPSAPAGTETAAPVVPESGAPAPVSAREKRKGPYRYSELTAKAEAAEARAAAAEAEKAQYARERDELRQRLETRREPEPAKEPEKPAEPEYTRPEPTEDEIGTKYKTYAEFARDLAKWVVEQERAASAPTIEQTVRQLLARERQTAQLDATMDGARERARKAYPDFDTLLHGPAGSIQLARSVEEAEQRVAFIAKHPQSEHIQYAILKDQKLAETLRDSDSYTFGVLVAGLVPKEPTKQTPTWTPPPPPPPMVGASSPTTAVSSSELAKKGVSFDEYREKRNVELGRKNPRWR